MTDKPQRIKTNQMLQKSDNAAFMDHFAEVRSVLHAENHDLDYDKTLQSLIYSHCVEMVSIDRQRYFDEVRPYIDQSGVVISKGRRYLVTAQYELDYVVESYGDSDFEHPYDHFHLLFCRQRVAYHMGSDFGWGVDDENPDEPPSVSYPFVELLVVLPSNNFVIDNFHSLPLVFPGCTVLKLSNFKCLDRSHVYDSESYRHDLQPNFNALKSMNLDVVDFSKSQFLSWIFLRDLEVRSICLDGANLNIDGFFDNASNKDHEALSFLVGNDHVEDLSLNDMGAVVIDCEQLLELKNLKKVSLKRTWLWNFDSFLKRVKDTSIDEVVLSFSGLAELMSTQGSAVLKHVGDCSDSSPTDLDFILKHFNSYLLSVPISNRRALMSTKQIRAKAKQLLYLLKYIEGSGEPVVHDDLVDNELLSESGDDSMFMLIQMGLVQVVMEARYVVGPNHPWFKDVVSMADDSEFDHMSNHNSWHKIIKLNLK